MNRFPHLAQRLFNMPLMLHPQKAEIAMAALADRLGIAQILHAQPLQPKAFYLDDDDDGDSAFTAAAERKPYEVRDRIACIQIEGTLVQRLGYLQAYSGMMGYDGIRGQIAFALADDDVDAIMLQIDSPGGEVAGCFDLVDGIFDARSRKPIWAVLDECACSAAYAIASAASFVTIPRTGIAGSIGVIAMLVDMSEALSKAGLKVNIIQFGAYKADGNEFEPLPVAARARFQAQIDSLGALFVQTVARNRKMAAKTVSDTEAATFMGTDAVNVGLADAVMAPDAAFQALLASL